MSKNISLVFEAVISVFNFTYSNSRKPCLLKLREYVKAEQAEEWLDENSHLINLNKVTDFNSVVEQIKQL